jgi:hypothetical protein
MDNNTPDPADGQGRSGEGAASIIPHLPERPEQVKAEPARAEDAAPAEVPQGDAASGENPAAPGPTMRA